VGPRPFALLDPNAAAEPLHDAAADRESNAATRDCGVGAREGSNTLSRSAAGMPTPLSETTNFQLSPARVASTSTRGATPGRPNLSAAAGKREVEDALDQRLHPVAALGSGSEHGVRGLLASAEAVRAVWTALLTTASGAMSSWAATNANRFERCSSARSPSTAAARARCSSSRSTRSRSSSGRIGVTTRSSPARQASAASRSASRGLHTSTRQEDRMRCAAATLDPGPLLDERRGLGHDQVYVGVVDCREHVRAEGFLAPAVQAAPVAGIPCAVIVSSRSFSRSPSRASSARR